MTALRFGIVLFCCVSISQLSKVKLGLKILCKLNCNAAESYHQESDFIDSIVLVKDACRNPHTDCRESKHKTEGALNSVEVKQLYFHSYQSMGFEAFNAFISWFL